MKIQQIKKNNLRKAITILVMLPVLILYVIFPLFEAIKTKTIAYIQLDYKENWGDVKDVFLTWWNGEEYRREKKVKKDLE